MICEERNTLLSKQALSFPVGILIGSPKRRLAKLGRKASSGSLQSSTSSTTTKSAEGVTMRQPAKSKIRRHNNRLSTVFVRGPQRDTDVVGDILLADDPSELSNQVSAPGILKIFGSDICQGANYKSVLATTRSSAKELVKEAVERYCLDKADAEAYVLCDVIGHIGEDRRWQSECSRVVGDNEKPLMLQSLWKPKEGHARRFEIQKRAAVEERNAREKDTVTAGINAQARKLQKVRSRVSSVFIDSVSVEQLELRRSLSEVELPHGQEAEWSLMGPARGFSEPGPHKEVQCVVGETKKSTDSGTQYSVHPPGHVPYFLLLQGYSYTQDFVIYLINCVTTVFGRPGESSSDVAVDISLGAPDILPQHCRVQRVESPHPGGPITTLTPLDGAAVSCNGIPLSDETELHAGDLIQLGEFYMFMFKDPTHFTGLAPDWLAQPRPHTQDPNNVCSSTHLESQPGPRCVPSLKGPDGCDLVLSYEREHEDRVLAQIMAQVDPSGPDPKLTPAFLLCLCIQHSAAEFTMPDFRRLLLRIASQVQITMWERTKELAAMQPEMADGGQQDADDACVLTMEQLIPGLQPLVLWMANAIELLHFIQQEVPKLLAWRVGDGTDLRDSDVPHSAAEEAVTVLEEVIMFTFQQSVYYITKTLYAALPGVLDGNPFSESGQLQVPAGVSGVVDVLQETMELLKVFQVHGEIASQLCAYLFFFINATLFNVLMERGPGGGFYQWSRGVQIRANLDLLMDWIQSVGLGDLALDFFQKLSLAVNLLATPKENLLQASWSSLRGEFTHLNPAQLHHMLREYNSGRPCPAGWSPTVEEGEAAARTEDILESFDGHPPLILPTSGFHLELDRPITDTGLCQTLQRVTLLSRPEQLQQPDDEPQLDTANTEIAVESRLYGVAETTASAPPTGTHLTCSEDYLERKLSKLELQSISVNKLSAQDSSCLLTPPVTPQGPELGGPEELGDIDSESSCKTSLEAAAHGDTAEEEEDVVFTVQLQRGPNGLGLALVDGMKTSLQMNGIYIKSIVEESPAAQCGKLGPGDRILAVNGHSLVGLDYNSGRDLIRTLGESLRLLVAKSELSQNSLTRF